LRKDLHRIVVSSEHLVRLINDLLDLAQAENGTLSVFPEPIEPHGFLTDLFESVAATLRDGNDVHWQLQLPDSLPPIMADPVRLRQILLNLLSNAAKFTTRGRIALGASAGSSELHIWVEDTGRGIPSELLSHIFESFVTAESTSSPTDRTREGVGMGLRVAHQLVSLHGGTLKIDSLLGYGTTCHLYWPMPLERGAEMHPVRSTSPSNEPLSALLDELIENASELAQRTAAYIHSHFATEISRRELADAVGVSPNYVTRVFRRETGLTPWQYLHRYRVAQAQRLLRESDISVTEIAAQVGFSDAAYFSRIFRRESGQPPALFRNQTN
jgi:AraC-like DNA-binding protein